MMPPNPDKKAVREAYIVPCPYCGAAIGHACHWRSDPSHWIATHSARVKAALVKLTKEAGNATV